MLPTNNNKSANPDIVETVGDSPKSSFKGMLDLISGKNNLAEHPSLESNNKSGDSIKNVNASIVEDAKADKTNSLLEKSIEVLEDILQDIEDSTKSLQGIEVSSKKDTDNRVVTEAYLKEVANLLGKQFSVKTLEAWPKDKLEKILPLPIKEPAPQIAQEISKPEIPGFELPNITPEPTQPKNDFLPPPKENKSPKSGKPSILQVLGAYPGHAAKSLGYGFLEKFLGKSIAGDLGVSKAHSDLNAAHDSFLSGNGTETEKDSFIGNTTPGRNDVPRRRLNKPSNVLASEKIESVLQTGNKTLTSMSSTLVRIEHLLGSQTDKPKKGIIEGSSETEAGGNVTDHGDGAGGIVSGIAGGRGWMGKLMGGLGAAAKGIGSFLGGVIGQKTGVSKEKSLFDEGGGSDGETVIEEFSSEALEELKKAFKAAIDESGGLNGGGGGNPLSNLGGKGPKGNPLSNLGGKVAKGGGLLAGAGEFLAGAAALSGIGLILGGAGKVIYDSIPTFNALNNTQKASDADLAQGLKESKAFVEKYKKMLKNGDQQAAGLLKVSLENEAKIEAEIKRRQILKARQRSINVTSPSAITRPTITPQSTRLGAAADQNTRLSNTPAPAQPVVISNPQTNQQNIATSHQTTISNMTGRAINKGSLDLAFYV